MPTPSPDKVRGMCVKVGGTALERSYLRDEDNGGGGERER